MYVSESLFTNIPLDETIDICVNMEARSGQNQVIIFFYDQFIS